jgi:hypothetical protein
LSEQGTAHNETIELIILEDGNSLKFGGNYTVTFRINHTETNEISASFNKTYPLQDIERGLASKEAVRELLAGLGIELTEAGETALLTIPETEVKAMAQLARGMAAEKSDNLVEALAFYTEAVGINPALKEASEHIQSFGGTIQTSSVRERAEQAQKEKEKWEKIFKDLLNYVNDKLVIAVYDFSVVEDRIYGSAVNLTIKPGVKFIPNRTVLAVWKTVMDNWEHIRQLPENKSWVGTANIREAFSDWPHSIGSSGTSQEYYVRVGLYDDYGDRIKTADVRQGLSYSYKNGNAETIFELVAQHKYYNDRQFKEVNFVAVPVDQLTDKLTPKIEGGTMKNKMISGTTHQPAVTVMSVAEWEQWLKEQGR